MKITKSKIKKIIRDSLIKESSQNSKQPIQNIRENVTGFGKGKKIFKYPNPRSAFYQGQEDYTIPELCLLWYQNLGKGRDLVMFGEGGKFNNHPDAEKFKDAASKILKNLFKNHSYNIVHPETGILCNAVIITQGNTYGSAYKPINVGRKLVTIRSGLNKNMKDHFMVTIGSAGIGGETLLEDPSRFKELILNPRHEDSFRQHGSIKFLNRYDFSKFGPVADYVSLSSEDTSQRLADYPIKATPYDIIFELDNQYNMPLNIKAPISKSGLKTGDAMYKLAEKNKVKIGDKVR